MKVEIEADDSDPDQLEALQTLARLAQTAKLKITITKAH